MSVTNFENLIGLEFKRNKYGLSLWSDKITYVGFRYKLIDRKTRTIETFVIGTLTKQWYALDEIVIVNKPINWVENYIMERREFAEKIQRGEIPDNLVKPISYKKDESN